LESQVGKNPMVKPTSVNTDLIPMATGAKGRNPRSAGNVMPGPSAEGGAMGGMSGAAGGVQGIPARNGGIAVSSGGYGQRTGSPGPNMAAVTPGNVPNKALRGPSNAALTHGRTLGAIAHLRSIGADHPHLEHHHAKATSALTGMRNAKMKKQGMAGGPKFGALGGSNASGAMGSGVPGVGSNMGGNPMGMAGLPDEM
jgi:hypothetical protein